MKIEEEKKLIYSLMKEIVLESRELSKAYFELKSQLNILSKRKSTELIAQNNLCNAKIELSQKQQDEKNKLYDNSTFTKKTRTTVPFERVAGCVIEMLREEGIPLSTKDIHEKLESHYEIYIVYANLTNNILRKIIYFEKYSIEKVTRGFYQYRKREVK